MTKNNNTSVANTSIKRWYLGLIFVQMRSTVMCVPRYLFFFSSRRRHTRSLRDWSSCALPISAEVAVAEAQARALVDLLASYVTAARRQARQVLLAVDEFSAVARRLPIWQLFE